MNEALWAWVFDERWGPVGSNDLCSVASSEMFVVCTGWIEMCSIPKNCVTVGTPAMMNWQPSPKMMFQIQVSWCQLPIPDVVIEMKCALCSRMNVFPSVQSALCFEMSQRDKPEWKMDSIGDCIEVWAVSNPIRFVEEPRHCSVSRRKFGRCQIKCGSATMNWKYEVWSSTPPHKCDPVIRLILYCKTNFKSWSDSEPRWLANEMLW